MKVEDIEQMIRVKLPDAVIRVETEDERHYNITVQSSQFRNLSYIEQHNIVYRALGPHVGTTLHAVSIKTIKSKE